jgi:ADP-L-glycero-D-manno-heptose 6-epimerase
METDGRYMMENNYRYSRELLDWCQEKEVPLRLRLVGLRVRHGGRVFGESRVNEAPLNVYGYSKFLFDQLCAAQLPGSLRADRRAALLQRLRAARAHKGRMASVAFHHFHQFAADGRVKLFEGSHGYANGEQRRDFVHVDDVVAVNLHFADKPVSGIYNSARGARRASTTSRSL